jgi:hypothetical protein
MPKLIMVMPSMRGARHRPVAADHFRAGQLAGEHIQVAAEVGQQHVLAEVPQAPRRYSAAASCDDDLVYARALFFMKQLEARG